MKRKTIDSVCNVNKKPKIEKPKSFSDIPKDVAKLIFGSSIAQERSRQHVLSFGCTNRVYNGIVDEYLNRFTVIPNDVIKHILNESVVQTKTCGDVVSLACTNKRYNEIFNGWVGTNLLKRKMMQCYDPSPESILNPFRGDLLSFFFNDKFRDAGILYYCAKRYQENKSEKSLYKSVRVFLREFDISINGINKKSMESFLYPDIPKILEKRSFECRLIAEKIEFINSGKSIFKSCDELELRQTMIKLLFFVKYNAKDESFSDKINSLIMYLDCIMIDDVNDCSYHDNYEEIACALRLLSDFCDCWRMYNKESSLGKDSHIYVRAFLNKIFNNIEVDTLSKFYAIIIGYHSLGEDDIVFQQFSVFSLLNEDLGEDEDMEDDVGIAKAYIIESMFRFVLNEKDVNNIKKVFCGNDGRSINLLSVLEEVALYFEEHDGIPNDLRWGEVPRQLLDITDKLESLELITFDEEIKLTRKSLLKYAEKFEENLDEESSDM